MSERLNHYKRDAIVSLALASKFDTPRDLLVDEEHNLALDCYHAAFSNEELKTVASLKPYWFYQTTAFGVNFGYKQIRLNFKKQLPIPYGSYGNYTVITNRSLIERFETLENNKKEYRDKRNLTEQHLRALLNSVTTLKSLSEAWPEGKKFYAEMDEPKASR